MLTNWGCAANDESYRTADVFCAPATGRESFGIILLEAMAAGKPVVASRIDGYASVLSDNNEAILVPPRDNEALAQALRSLLTDESLRAEMGARGRVNVMKYSCEQVAGSIFDYYTRILAEPPWQKLFTGFDCKPGGQVVRR